MREIPWVARDAWIGEGELSGYSLPEDDRPGGAQGGDHRCVAVRLAVGERGSTRGRRHACRVEDVFQRNDDPMQRTPGPSSPGACVEGICRAPGLFPIYDYPGPQRGVITVDLLKTGVDRGPD